MGNQKAIAIVLREYEGRKQVLVFRHPTEGVQIVKGNIDPGETPADAARRELLEESGLGNVVGLRPCGEWTGDKDTVWHFFVCELAAPPPHNWQHFTEDGGGLTFEYFWFDVDDEPGPDWKESFVKAFPLIRSFAQ